MRGWKTCKCCGATLTVAENFKKLNKGRNYTDICKNCERIGGSSQVDVVLCAPMGIPPLCGEEERSYLAGRKRR